MNPRQVLEQHFSDEVSATAYINARLNTTKMEADALVSHYHVDERVEDELFTVYHEEGVSAGQQQWLWQAINALAADAWQQQHADVFERVVYLYWRLGYAEAVKFKWQNFLAPAQIQWQKGLADEKIGLYSNALWMTFFWQLEPNNSLFWRGQFKAIVELLPDNEKLLRPLNHVSDALEEFTDGQWQMLFANCGDKQYLRDMVRQYLTVRFALCKEYPEKQRNLIDAVHFAASALASSRQGLNKAIADIILAWCEKPWWSTQDDIKAGLGELHKWLTGYVNRQTKPQCSPRTMYSSSAQLKKAA